MNCKDLTTNLTEIQIKAKTLGDSLNGMNPNEMLSTQSDLTDFVEPIYDEVEPNQLARRDRIAKELGLCWLDKFHEGLAWARKGVLDKCLRLVTKEGGLIDTFSERIYNALEAKPFKEGIAWASFQWNSGAVWSLVSADKGILNMDIKYEIVDFDSDGIYPVKKWPADENKWMLAKHNGDKLSVDGVEEFFFATTFHDDRAWVQTEENEPYKLIDSEGNVIFEGKFESVQPFSEGVSIVKKDKSNYWDLILPDGEFVGLGAMEIISAGDSHNGIIKVGINQRQTEYLRLNYINNRIFKQFPLSFVSRVYKGLDFSNGFASVTNVYDDGPIDVEKSFYIDARGLNIFEKNFREAQSFSEGAAVVIPDDGGTDSRWIYIGTDGEPLFLDETGRVKYFSVAEPFKDGIAKVFDDPFTEPYYIDKKGKRVFEEGGKQ